MIFIMMSSTYETDVTAVSTYMCQRSHSFKVFLLLIIANTYSALVISTATLSCLIVVNKLLLLDL